MKTNITNVITVVTLALGLPLLSPTLLPAAPAQAATLSDGTYSQLPIFTKFQLPDNGKRITDKEFVEALTEPLTSFAKETRTTLKATEILQWDDSSAPAMLESTLSGAGYSYKTLGETKKDDVTMTIFAARRDSGDTALGYWLDRKGQLTLVWGSTAPKAAPKPAVEPEAAPAAKADGDILPSRTEAPAAAVSKPDKQNKVPVPPSLVGPTWSWTTIGGVNYTNRNTGQLLEPSGMSASYTFTKDGRYTFFFFVRQRTYSLVTQSATNHEGRVVFTGDNTFTLYPDHGTYKGFTGSKIIDRPMTAAERTPVKWYYEWRTENGKRQLYIGPNKSSAKAFKQG